MDLKQAHLDQLWKDDKNWKMGLVYFCKKDPRIVVKKRPYWIGWTMNMARYESYIILLTIIALAILIPLYLEYLY